MKLNCSALRLPLLVFGLLSSIAVYRSASAAPTMLSGTTTQASSNNSVLKLSIGDSFAAAMDLDATKAVGQVEARPGISGEGMRYTGISGSIEVTIGGVSREFSPLFLVIGNDFADAAGAVSQPVDLWHLHAVSPDGVLLLTIGLWERDGSAIDSAELFIPEETEAFASATWALFAPPDRIAAPAPPRLDNIASGVIDRWITPFANPRR